MKVEVWLDEGYEPALYGMSLSFKDRAVDCKEWWARQKERAEKRAVLLAPKGAGHNKFIRQIHVWVEIEAARAWWSEFDTYGVGVVRNSESTMHTLAKRGPLPEDFEEGTDWWVIDAFIRSWEAHKGDITRLKLNLPEGFLQRRMVTFSYANIKDIIEQREGHRFEFWGQFLKDLLPQLKHPELLPKLKDQE